MSTNLQSNSSHALLWLGLVILACLFIFKWIPDWTWQADLPEIKVNNYIFEARPNWQGETAIIESDTKPTIYIRISPKKAIDERAHLKVTVNDKEVSNNCTSGTDYFCYNIPNRDNFDGSEYSIVAKNDAGETHATIKVIIKSKSSSSSTPTTDTTTDTNSSQPQSTAPTNTVPTNQPSSSVNPNTCLHSVSGVCLDDYEDEAYSAGLYDYSYGRYGTSLDYPDNCNDTCKEALEDAYDEGWYDSH